MHPSTEYVTQSAMQSMMYARLRNSSQKMARIQQTHDSIVPAVAGVGGEAQGVLDVHPRRGNAERRAADGFAAQAERRTGLLAALAGAEAAARRDVALAALVARHVVLDDLAAQRARGARRAGKAVQTAARVLAARVTHGGLELVGLGAERVVDAILAAIADETHGSCAPSRSDGGRVPGANEAELPLAPTQDGATGDAAGAGVGRTVDGGKISNCSVNAPGWLEGDNLGRIQPMGQALHLLECRRRFAAGKRR
eukprot:scaffold48_cov311-Pinguiococcus_pyrenoidosus.AAC.227